MFLVCSRYHQKPTPLSIQAWINSFWIYLSFIRNRSFFILPGNKSIPWWNHFLHQFSYSPLIYEIDAWVYTLGFGLSDVFSLLPLLAPPCFKNSLNHNKHSDIVKTLLGLYELPTSLKHIYQRKPGLSTCKPWSCKHYLFKLKILTVWWWFHLFIWITVSEI